MVSGMTMVITSRIARTATIGPDEQGAVEPTQPRSTTRRTPLQDIELVPQDQILDLQLPLRFEAVAQHADEQHADCNHSTIMF